MERKHGIICRHVFHRDRARVRYWRRPWLQALLAIGLAQRGVDKNGKAKKGGKIIPHVIVHDFRRTAIRNFARAGVSEAVAMRLSGHETREVFDRYNIVTGDDLLAAAAKLNVATFVTGTVTGKVAAVGGGFADSRAPKSAKKKMGRE